jgi:hypothetical protein
MRSSRNQAVRDWPPQLRRRVRYVAWYLWSGRLTVITRGGTTVARVTTVRKARKAQPTNCLRCNKKIEVGQGYRWLALRIANGSITRRLHVTCGSFKRSETTLSDKLGRVWDAQDDLGTAISQWGDEDDIEDLRSALETAAETAQEVGDEYEESLGNMPDGLQQGDTGQQIQEKADQCHEWNGELTDAAGNLEEFEQADDGTESSREDWATEQRQTAQEACDALQL